MICGVGAKTPLKLLAPEPTALSPHSTATSHQIGLSTSLDLQSLQNVAETSWPGTHWNILNGISRRFPKGKGLLSSTDPQFLEIIKEIAANSLKNEKGTITYHWTVPAGGDEKIIRGLEMFDSSYRSADARYEDRAAVDDLHMKATPVQKLIK